MLFDMDVEAQHISKCGTANVTMKNKARLVAGVGRIGHELAGIGIDLASIQLLLGVHWWV